MNTEVIIGATIGIVISVGGCIAWYVNGVKKRNKRNKTIVDEYRMILTCLLQEHNPSMFIAIREDSFGEVTAILKAHGASYNATSSFGTHDMVEQAKKANEFFRRQKLIRWVEDNPMPPEPPKVEPESAEIIRLAQKVADAYTKPGIAPDYHYRKMAQLRTEWPTLSAAVCNLTGYMKEHN